MSPKADSDVKLRIFERMLRMRRLEERVLDLSARKLVPGHYHLYTGQEAAGAAVLEALGPNDLLLTTHRNHGHIVGRGSDPGRLLAEILGREGGLNRGRGGTLHATDRSRGFLQTSALVGGVVPLAVGASYAIKQAKQDGVAVAFFGDGALEEGVVYESLNIAALWALPIILVCENNSIGAVGQQGGGYPTSINAAAQFARIPQVFGIKTHVFAGTNDVAAIHATARDAVRQCKAGGGPVFIEVVTVRWPGSQPLWPEAATGTTDLAMAWGERQPTGPHRDWIASHDPVLRVARELLADGIDRAAIESIDARIGAELEIAERYAVASPLPDPAGAAVGTFA